MPTLVRPFFVAITALVSVAGTSGCDSKEKAPEAPQLEVSVVDIGKRDVVLSSEFVGRTKGAIDAEVRARVEGVLQEIHFQDEVR
jgi:membrane fusion protein (multidrug efflux system)